MVSASQAFERLREGNRRFASNARANVRASAKHMRHGSQILEELERDEGLVIVGAEYSLDTGLVNFFDGVPA